MGLSVLDMILSMQSDYYKKYNRAVTTLVLNLEIEYLNDLHGMQIVIKSDRKIQMH